MAQTKKAKEKDMQALKEADSFISQLDAIEDCFIQYGEDAVTKKANMDLENAKKELEICQKVAARVAYVANMIKRQGRVSTRAEEVANRMLEEKRSGRSSQMHKTRSHLYMMVDKRNGMTKIGISKDPKVRERTLQSEVPQISIIYSTKESVTPYIRVCYRRSERFLHDLFSAKRVRGEWFDLNAADIEFVQQFCEAVDVAKTQDLRKVAAQITNGATQ